MKRLSHTFSAVAAATLTVAACVPIFSNGDFQTLRLVFELSQTIDEGQEETVQVSAFPLGAKVRKNFVQLSGRLTAAANTELPARVRVLAVFENQSSGKVTQRVPMTLNIRDGGLFSASKRLKKNVGAGDLMTVTLQPTGGALAKSSEITLCVDLVKKKADLKKLPACVEADGGDGGGAAITLSSLQNDFLTPSCARSGCHTGAAPSAGLSLVQGQSFGDLVNVPSSQSASLNRVTPNDPEVSYLIKKLRGDSDIVGERMPRGGPFLTAAEIERFVDWINDGAPDN